MEKSESIGKLAEALSKAQGAIQGAVKDTTNVYFKSKYADLSSVWEACRKPLSDNGLSVVQIPVFGTESEVNLCTMLIHSSGEYISGVMAMKPIKTDPQGVGSCLTYLRRYCLSAFVGVAPEDDDGNAASQKPEFKSQATTKPYDMHPNEPKDVPVSMGDVTIDEATLIADLKTDLSNLMGKWGFKTKKEKGDFYEYIKRGRPETVDMLQLFKDNFMANKQDYLEHTTKGE